MRLEMTIKIWHRSHKIWYSMDVTYGFTGEVFRLQLDTITMFPAFSSLSKTRVQTALLSQPLVFQRLGFRLPSCLSPLSRLETKIGRPGYSRYMTFSFRYNCKAFTRIPLWNDFDSNLIRLSVSNVRFTGLAFDIICTCLESSITHFNRALVWQQLRVTLISIRTLQYCL